MSQKKTKTVEEMKAERRALDRAIRAAKRAEQKAAAEQLASAHRLLGEWVATLCGADTAEAVATLHEDAKTVSHHLRSLQVVSESSDTDTAPEEHGSSDNAGAPAASGSSDNESAGWAVEEVGSDDAVA